MTEYEILMLERLRQQALAKKLIQDFQRRLEAEKPIPRHAIKKNRRHLIHA